MNQDINSVETVRASRAGHTFHERWTARRALQLVFPRDDLFAIAVEGLSTNESAKPGDEAEDIADLILYFGQGDTFKTCRALQTLQFKYKADSGSVTSSYLKKTVEKFALTLLGYEKDFVRAEIDSKLSFSFVTNADFAPHLWAALRCLKDGSKPDEPDVKYQYRYLKKWCEEKNVDAGRLFSLIDFQAATRDLPAQNRQLSKILSDWTPGVDSQAKMRLHGLEELIREKAGLAGQRNNLVKREDVLNSLGCEPEDLFPANTEFVDVGAIVKRDALAEVENLIEKAISPILINADGGVGKTVFIQSLAQNMQCDFETVVFDCFGGGSYRAEDEARHLPKIGLLQIVNELASRGLCDPQLPTDGDRHALIKAARKRFEQAAATVKAQSLKSGILLIIDAADNAQLEAEHRKEDAFPRLLLSNLSRTPVDGVKLVLTARPHRMESVIGKCEVQRFKLDVFSVNEARDFLESRRPDLNDWEFSKALVRSGRNARVLDYLVSSWEENILGSTSKEEITVTELIRQRCDKIHVDLYRAGWGDDEIKQFFVAISLLPPPIPLNEMADALGWSQSKVNSAIADLAPMLELLKHGAIFRDEPTETYIRETYGSEKQAQQNIADRLYAHQTSSAYAAEALPHFLVVINDSQRAHALSISEQYPSSVLSEYGRRRLRLLRLHAGFTLAVKARNYDLVLSLSMKLAQVASANAKGDNFIRSSPGVSVCLGDQDVSRRLFQDRSGWRGERDSRLTVSFAFQSEIEEAEIHQNRAIGWINWHHQNRRDGEMHDNDGPSVFDLASVMFVSILKGDYRRVDTNIVNWNASFALEVINRVINLIQHYEIFTGERILTKLSKFVSSKECETVALQVCLLASNSGLNKRELKLLARATNANARKSKIGQVDNGYHYEKEQQKLFCDAGFSALIYASRNAASNILRAIKIERISKYSYGERYGSSESRSLILRACIDAWVDGEELCFYHLLPREVEVTRAVKRIINLPDLSTYLGELKEVRSNRKSSRKDDGRPKKQFTDHDCWNITKGIALVISLARPLQQAVLARRDIVASDFHDFLACWKSKLRLNIHLNAEDPQDFLGRDIGIGFVEVFLQYSTYITTEDCQTLIDLLSQGRFRIADKLNVLSLMARHTNLQEKTGLFAKTLAAEIRKDEFIDQRANQYSQLSEALLPLSIAEAQHYFREGLSQLDQMGGDDYDIVYSLLRYAAQQSGGWIKPALGHRLMNLCQAIFRDEPTKFSWALFGQAAAQSIGHQALFKIIRWSDQDICDFSYGLPQLACYLAKNGHLDARRATAILLLCKEHGWYEWKIDDGLEDILNVAEDTDRPVIFHTLFAKLKLENPLGGSKFLWDGLLRLVEKFPSIDQSFLNELKLLGAGAQKNDEQERDNASYEPSYERPCQQDPSEIELDNLFIRIIEDCDIESPHSIDTAIRICREDRRLKFNSDVRIIGHLREKCLFEERHQFIHMLTELVELDFDVAMNAIQESIVLWEQSTAHISSNKKDYIRKIFEARGSDLFNLRYTGILREIRHLIAFCDDEYFVLELIFDTLAKEKVELTGDEWLQLATCLCPYTSRSAQLAGLEDLLSGPAAKLGDEIGEGPFQTAFSANERQSNITASIYWHILGNGDTFTRWAAARNINYLVELSLHEDVDALFDCFDNKTPSALISENMDSSFLNSKQWFLMGLTRSSFYHASSLTYLQNRLESLAARNDIHAVNKIHILRCIANLSKSVPSVTVQEFAEKIYVPATGYEEGDSWAQPGNARTEFHFGYEFYKHEVASLARLFGITKGEAVDAIASEITRIWPEAKNMDYFHGYESFNDAHAKRYESYRSSVQRQALLSAATTLTKSLPVIRSRHEPEDACPWIDWLRSHDVTFTDGTWLSDQKDDVPIQAKKRLLDRNEKTTALESDETLLRSIGILGSGGPFFPIYGYWCSTDGVRVRITSALAPKKGAVGLCKKFSQLSDYDIWLPTFGFDGDVDPYIKKSEFEPIIWSPENYQIGIDSGDEYASRFATERPRIGKKLTALLRLKSDEACRDWFDDDGHLILRNQVWGQWKPEPSDHRNWFQDDGQVLWARSDRFDSILSELNRTLVLHIDFYKHKPYKSYDQASGVRGVYICLRTPNGAIRYWKAKKASKTIY